MTNSALQTRPQSRKEAEAAEAARSDTDGTRPRRGRRPSHTEHWTKVTVVLLDRQIVFLDRLVADIRAASGMAISRAHVIRALVDALAESDLDLTSTRSEGDLNSILTNGFRHRAS